jgi:hypothetical protein
MQQRRHVAAIPAASVTEFSFPKVLPPAVLVHAKLRHFPTDNSYPVILASRGTQIADQF